MKQYTVLADSITGIKGKQLVKGQKYPESEINSAHIDDLVKQGFIEEYTAPAPEKPTKAKD